MSKHRFNLIVLVLIVSGAAWAAEPTRVNFAARRQNEDLIVKRLESFLAGDQTSSVPADDAKTFKELVEPFRRVPSLQKRLVEIYFSIGRKGEFRYQGNLGRFLNELAVDGRLTSSVLETILRETPNGRLASVVKIAIKRNPSLDTPELRTKIHEQFSRIVRAAHVARDIDAAMLELADPEKVKMSADVAKKLNDFVSGKDRSDFGYVLLAHPKLLPAIASDLPVPTLSEAQSYVAKKILSNPLTAGRFTNGASVETPGVRDIVPSAFAASRDRLRFLMNQDVKPASAESAEHELLDAFDFFRTIEPESFLTDLQNLAVAPFRSDNVRQGAMLTLMRSTGSHPEVRKTIFEAASLLTELSPVTLTLIADSAAMRPLSTDEKIRLRDILRRAHLPNDKVSKAALVQIRRGTFEAVPSVCPNLFRSSSDTSD